MRSRGADRPDGDADQRNEQPGKSRRLFGRARPEPVEPEVVPTEETGWLDDLRSAKQDRSAIGPGKPTDGKSSKSGKTAPAPDDVPDDAPPFLSADPDAAPRGAPPIRGGVAPTSPARPGTPVSPARGRPDAARPPATPHGSGPARDAGRPPAAPYDDGAVAGPPAARDAGAPPATYGGRDLIPGRDTGGRPVGTPYGSGPPPAQYGQSGVVGRPVSPPPPAPASGGGAGGARARFQDADGTWHSGSGEYPSGTWRTVPGESGTGRHNSPLNPDGTDEAGPGRGRRQIDPGQLNNRVDRGRPVSGGPLPGRPVSGSPTSGGPMPTGPVSAVPMSGNAPAVPTPTSPAGPRRGTGPVPPQNLPGPAGRPVPPVEPPARAPGRPPAGNTGGGRHATGEFTPVSARDYIAPDDRPAGRRAAPDPDDSQQLYGSRGGSGYTPRRGGGENSDHPMGRGAEFPEPPRGGAGRPVSAMPAPDGSSFGSRNTGTTGRARPGEITDDEGTGRHGVPGPGPMPGSPAAGPVSPGQHTDPRARGQRPGSDGPPPAGGQHTGPLTRGQRPGPDGQHSGPVPGGRGQRGPVQGGQRPGPGNATGRRAAPDASGERPAGWPDAGGGNPPPAQPGRAAASARPGGPAAAAGLGAAGLAAGPRGAGQAARASAAVVPPVVPGREGARTPAVPGRAGAMADSPSGVIQRPGETTGRAPGRVAGRGPGPSRQPGQGEPGRATRGRARPGTAQPGDVSQPLPGRAGDYQSGRPAAGDFGQPGRAGAGPAGDFGQPGRAGAGPAGDFGPGRAGAGRAGDFGQGRPGTGQMPGRPGTGRPGEVSQPIPGRAGQGVPDQAGPGHRSRPSRPVDLGEPPTPRPDTARPGDVSQPLHGLAGAPMPGAPIPGPVNPPLPGRDGRPGDTSRPVPGRAGPGDVSQPLPGRGAPGDVSQPLPGSGGRSGDGGPVSPGRHEQPGDLGRPVPGRAVPGRAVPGRAVPGRAVPGDVSQALPGRGGPPGDLGRNGTSGGVSGRGGRPPVDVSQPLQGLAGPPVPRPGHAAAPRPGQVSQPIGLPQPGREPGAPPVRGTGAVAAAPGRVAAVAAVGAPGVPPMVDDGRTPGKAAVRSATADGPWADAVDGPDEDDEIAGGLRSELRAKLRSQRRLRVISLVSLSILVLGLLPLFFGIRAASRDPVFNSLDALDVPGWAAEQIDDKSSGSRWCFLDCRFRERSAQSERPFEETSKAYTVALKSAGWQPWKVGQCPEQPISDGKYTCWRRDEFTLDLWVRLPECAVDAVAAQDPATLPSAGPDGVVSTEKPADCVGSTVSIKVQNAITDQRGKPQQAPDPGLIGETPDPVLSTDPLLDPTPSPS